MCNKVWSEVNSANSWHMEIRGVRWEGQGASGHPAAVCSFPGWCFSGLWRELEAQLRRKEAGLILKSLRCSPLHPPPQIHLSFPHLKKIRGMQCVGNKLYCIISYRKVFMGHFIRKCRY